MNKKFLVAWLVAFIVWMGGSFAVHGVWLAGQYEALASLYRPADDQMQYMGWMVGAHVIMAGALAWIYGRGISAAPWMGQGIRFGIALAVLVTPLYMVYYAVQPLPMSLMVCQMIGDAVVMLALGLSLAFVHKSASTS